MNIFDYIDTDYLYLLSMAGDDVYINDNIMPCKAIINSKGLIRNTSVNGYTDLRTISSTEILKCGDIITWDNEQWLIISEIGQKRFNHYKGIIQKCNYKIKMIFEDGIVREYPCIIDSKVFDVETNKFINTPTGKIIVLLQDNEESRMIGIDKRFIKMDKAFKVVGDDRTDNGLITLYCDLDSFNSTADDIENEIADYETYKHTYTIEITNGDPITVNILSISEFEILSSCTDNGEVVTPDDIEYTISNPLVGRIEGSNFICIGTGTTTLTATWNGVSDSITIIGIAEEVHNYAVTITGEDTIYYNQTGTYNAVFTDNGSPTTKNAQWVIKGDDGQPTTYATIQSQTDTTCTIKAGTIINVYVNLTVSANDTSCQDTKRIAIRSLL
jgi:hypothetical protein